jgi:hypothetical protein
MGSRRLLGRRARSQAARRSSSGLSSKRITKPHNTPTLAQRLIPGSELAKDWDFMLITPAGGGWLPSAGHYPGSYDEAWHQARAETLKAGAADRGGRRCLRLRCWHVPPLQLRSGGSSSQCASVGRSDARWNDTNRRKSRWGRSGMSQWWLRWAVRRCDTCSLLQRLPEGLALLAVEPMASARSTRSVGAAAGAAAAWRSAIRPSRRQPLTTRLVGRRGQVVSVGLDLGWRPLPAGDARRPS